MSTPFIGREDLVKAILAHFADEPTESYKRPRVLSIWGLAGEGKSRLALEVSLRSRERYSGVYWVNASTDVTAMQSFETLAAELGSKGRFDQQEHNVSVNFVRDQLKSRNARWLMVFDSYDRPEEFPDVKRLIPSGGRGDIIITSRSNYIFNIGHMVLHLPPMTEQDALDLLLSGYIAEEINVHRSDWSEVAGRLGHLALSLHQAGIYLKHMKMPIGSSRDFLTTYNSKQRDIVQCLPSSFWEYWRTQCHETTTQERAISAFITWEMILDRVGTVEGQPETFIRPFLSTLAFLDPTQIGDFIFRGWTTAAPDWTEMFSGLGEDAATTGMQSLSVAEASSNDVVEVDGAASREETAHNSVLQIPRQWNSGKFERCVRRLYELSLLNRFSGTDARIDSFHLHPLVRDWVQAKQDVNARQHYTHVAIGFVTSAYIAHGPLTTAQLWLLRVHVDACVWNDTAFVHPKYRLGHDESTCPSAECFATLSGFPGRYELARKLSSLVVETRKQCLGSEDALTLGPMNFLAEVYGHLGRKWEAEELKKQVIYITWNARATSPIETSSFFMKMRGLILLYQSEERYKEAEDLTLDMIEKIKRVSTVDGFDPLGFDIVVANRMLAAIYQMQQKWEAATERYSSVLDANTRMLGGDSDVTLESKMDLARVLVFQGRRNSAKLLEDEVKEARRTVPLVRNPHWIDNLDNLSSVGEPPEARPQRSKTLRKWPNPDSTDTERIREIIRLSKLPPEVRAKMPMGYSDNALEYFVPISLDHSDDSNLSIRYTPLVQNKSEIRLLTLYPGEFESMICCKLTHAFLEMDPNYTALSYCWNETNEENGNNGAEIFLNDRATRVTNSAEIALRYLRKPKEHAVVWIDAICINQRDLVEKSRQVRMMGKIYSHASEVRVWLGESADDSDAAMDFLNGIHQKDFASTEFTLDEGIWTALKRLRKRKWWSRMWIIQEALFANSLKFYCGEKSTDRKAFARLHELERQLDNGRGHGDRLAPMQMTLAAPFGVILDDWDQYREDIANGGIRLRRLLSVTEDARCTEPLDNIFALLSMCTELDREVLQIDYRVSMRWAMTNLCKYELIAREIYDPLWVLQTCRTHKDPMLPSWVPNYSRHDDDGRLSFPAHEGKTKYRAAAQNTDWVALGLAPQTPVMVPHFNSITIKIEDEGSFETLVLTGLVVDVVQAAFRAPWVEIYEGFSLAEDLERKADRRAQIVSAAWEWEQYTQSLPPGTDPYLTTCSRYEAFWRTLICDRDFSWFGPSSLEEQDFAGRFEAWMRRHPTRNDDEEYIRPFNRAAVHRCMQRSFVVTEKGYFGLGSDMPRPGDVVCVLKGGDVPFILRPRLDEYFEKVGEAYVHGIMDGSFVLQAKREDLREFRIR